MPKPRFSIDRKYFFDGGVRFECTGCGACCTGAPGTVFVNQADAPRIAKFLGMDLDAFLTKYAYPFEKGHSLHEKPNGDCIFFESGRCSIYPVRPTQCRTYPFWLETMRSEQAWEETCAACPGIGRGRLYSREEILAKIHETLEAEENERTDQGIND